jgi:PKD repeat protein
VLASLLKRLAPVLLLAAGSLAVPAAAQAAAPVASFGYSPDAPVTGETVTFTSTSTDSDGRIVWQAWDLDNDGHYDDGGSTTASVSNFSSGDHRVGLMVMDDDGNWRTTHRTLTVTTNGAPTAAFSANPSTADTGQAVTLTSTSTDPDGRPLTESWDLDNNGTFGDKTGHQVTTSWADDGTKTVSLRVTDSGGSVRTVSHTVTVNNRAPNAAFAMSATDVDSGTPVVFTSTSSDPDGSIASYAWDFDGNGTTDATGATVTRSFAHSGTPSVTLKVTDNDGATRSVSRQLTVRNRPPTVAFGLSASDVDSGSPVTFTSSSSDPDGSIASYEWDFDGNGTTDATGPTASRAWDHPGTPTVTLTVTDDEGAKRSTSQKVNVHNRPPNASFHFSPSDPFLGELVTLTSDSSDSDGSVASEKWDLDGDGAFDDDSGKTTQVRFQTEGKHKVSLEVTDDDGAKTTVSTTFDVTKRPDPAPFSSPSPPSSKTPISPKLMKPFPLVRISGMTTTKGVRIDVLSVRTGHGAKVTIRCKGRHKGCPFKRKVVTARGKVRRRHMPGFHRRYLRAGAVVEVFVTRSGAIGKYTRFKVRRLKPPTRVDSCTAVSVAKVKRCPSA